MPLTGIVQEQIDDAQLGDLVRDVITGFEGVVVSITHHISGGKTVDLRKVLGDQIPAWNSRNDAQFPFARLKIVEKGYLEKARAGA